MPKGDGDSGDQAGAQKIPETPEKLLAKIAEQQRTLQTTESTAYLRGLYAEFAGQVRRYHDLTHHVLELQARVELAEKTLSLMRDHLAETVNRTEFAAPHDWEKTFRSVRFVGVRLADACLTVLREHKIVTGAEMVAALNRGMFRFRTSAPLREIHAALISQKRHVRKTDTGWEWVEAARPQQQGLRLLGPDGSKTRKGGVKAPQD